MLNQEINQAPHREPPYDWRDRVHAFLVLPGKPTIDSVHFSFSLGRQLFLCHTGRRVACKPYLRDGPHWSEANAKCAKLVRNITRIKRGRLYIHWNKPSRSVVRSGDP